MKRTTVRLPEPLLTEAKKLAADTGRTLTAVLEDALHEALARKQVTRNKSRVRFTTFGGRGLFPGVDLDNSAALLELMEQPHGAD